jgi:arsenite-transporting ATPase
VSLPFFLHNHKLKLILFGGKGGVGKTTSAVATAFRLANSFSEKSVFLVSTDPAHSLEDSLAGFLPPPNLKILELDAQECLATFKENYNGKLREIASRGTFLDEEDINQFLDLSLPGLDELMAFMEISKYVEDGSYDCIVVDTAPTGHTLRLLAMPELIRKWIEVLDVLLAKHRYMKRKFNGAYKLDDLDIFLIELSGQVKQLETLLQDTIHCRFVPVMLPEELSIRETLTLLDELERLKVPVTDIIVNKLYSKSDCPVCADWRVHQMMELGRFTKKLRKYSIWGIPLYQDEIRGLKPIGMFWDDISALDILPSEANLTIDENLYRFPGVENAGDLPSPEIRLLLFIGKGGVGKTTMACATAVRMTQENSGKEIFIFSTDPAHSLSDCFNIQIGNKPTRLVPGLTAMEIDAQKEFETLKKQYAMELEKFLEAIFPNIDLTFDREVMERIMDLSPPGLDEIMALNLAMRFFDQKKYDIFILDTAPTGHLIRLMELPELVDKWLKTFFGLFLKYKRIFRLPNISQRLVQMSKELKSFRSLIKDPVRSAGYAVTILTEMAFNETEDLIAACHRLGINVPVLFLNLATPLNKCPLCSGLYKRESRMKEKFQHTFFETHQTVVYRRGELRGLQQLKTLGETVYKQIYIEIAK